jgi:hypothetical protein
MSRKRSGAANVEFLLYMTLLLVLGLLVFSLAAAGSGAYAKLLERKARDGQLRVAVSYLEVEIRKHDAVGAIRLGTNPFGEGPALFLADEYSGETYEKMVFCQDGSLCELLALKGSETTFGMATTISSVDRIEIENEGTGLRVRAIAEDGTKLETYLDLRSFEGTAS